MNGRRDLLRKSALLAAGIIATSATKSFASPGEFQTGVVYTKDNPGKWSKKVGSHAPQVRVEGKTVTITTAHPMLKRHYIVRHTLVSQSGQVIGEKTFFQEDKKAVSTHELPEGQGTTFLATSFCNLHDFWLTEFSV